MQDIPEKIDYKPLINLDAGMLIKENPIKQSYLTDLSNIDGMIPTVSAVPTVVPRKFSEQIVLVVTGGNSSLYVFDRNNNKWKSVAIS